MAVAKASVKIQRISSSKANLVANLVRNRPVGEALSILKYTPKKSSQIITNVLNSAIANAVNNFGMNAEKLYIQDVQVMQGPTLKRFRPGGRGQAKKILKRTSHFMVEVAER